MRGVTEDILAAHVRHSGVVATPARWAHGRSAPSAAARDTDASMQFRGDRSATREEVRVSLGLQLQRRPAVTPESTLREG